MEPIHVAILHRIAQLLRDDGYVASFGDHNGGQVIVTEGHMEIVITAESFESTEV